ncbi:MAG: FlgD immunoglobulin-like domain containing protein [candidate division WOR-3 bacterium]
MLAPEEQQILVDVLNAGKGLYIENPDLGFAHSGTVLYQMLGATYLGDGNYYATGNVQSVTGQAGTFVAGMSYNYMFQQIPDNYVDYIGSNGGTILFRSQENYGRVICYGGPSNSYRSIYSTFNLGALRNGTNTKLQLVEKYMEYLLQTVIAEEADQKILIELNIFPNPAIDNIRCRLALNNREDIKIKIYDATGRIVRTLMNNELGVGTYEFCWDRHDNAGRPVSSGSYIFIIEMGNKTMMKSVTLIR